MKKIYIFALTLAMVAVSCQKDVHQEVMHQDVVSVSNDDNGYAVSVDEALANLDRELDFIYGASTRSGDRPNVRKVHTLHRNTVANATRSGEVNAEELLYIVEFDEGQGSAILGADKRVEKVFAVLDESVITLEDFENAESGQNTDDLSTRLAGLIVDEAYEQLGDSDFELKPLVPGLRVSYSVYDTIVNESAQTLLRTKWGQQSYYNDYCFGYNGNEKAAGCVPIAAAQLILYNNYPDQGFINLYGQQFDRNILNLDRYPRNIPDGYEATVRDHVARYVGLVSDSLVYSQVTSSSSIDRIPKMLRDLGYSYADVIECDGNNTFDREIRQLLYVQKKPTVFEADYDSWENGHVWVIDGYMYNKVNHWWYTKEGLNIISQEFVGVEESRKVHCNFGWYGYCDGYYTYAIFDVREPLDEKDIVEEVGDRPSYEDVCFDKTPSVLVYSF